MIDAIPRWHGRYLMRSTAEAAWAGVMDGLRIRYAYEPGVWLTRHGGYMPDFLIPAAGCFLEVKGQAPTIEEREKAEDLTEATGMPVVFGYGRLQAGEFNGVLLPMGSLLVRKRGRWESVPLSAVGELVYENLGMAFGLAMAMSCRPRARDIGQVPPAREELEAFMASVKARPNDSLLTEHRVINRSEAAAGAAASWMLV